MLCGQLCAGARGGVFDGIFGCPRTTIYLPRSFAMKAFRAVLCDATLRACEFASSSSASRTVPELTIREGEAGKRSAGNRIGYTHQLDWGLVALATTI